MLTELSRSISIEGFLYLLDVNVVKVVKVAGLEELGGLFHLRHEFSTVG